MLKDDNNSAQESVIASRLAYQGDKLVGLSELDAHQYFALIARHVLRFMPEFQAPDSVSNEDAKDLINALNVLVWTTGYTAFSKDAYSSPLLWNVMADALMVIDGIYSDNLNYSDSIGLAIAAANAHHELVKLHDIELSEILRTRYFLHEALETIMDMVETSSTQISPDALKQAFGDDLQQLNTHHSIQELGRSALWQAKLVPPQLKQLLEQWYALLNERNCQQWVNCYKQLKTGDLDWQTVTPNLHDWAQAHSIGIIEEVASEAGVEEFVKVVESAEPTKDAADDDLLVKDKSDNLPTDVENLSEESLATIFTDSEAESDVVGKSEELEESIVQGKSDSRTTNTEEKLSDNDQSASPDVEKRVVEAQEPLLENATESKDLPVFTENIQVHADDDKTKPDDPDPATRANKSAGTKKKITLATITRNSQSNIYRDENSHSDDNPKVGLIETVPVASESKTANVKVLRQSATNIIDSKPVKRKSSAKNYSSDEPAKHELDASVLSADTLLKQVQNTAIRFQVHKKIWTLGFDAVVIPTNQNGDLDGEFATALSVDLGNKAWNTISKVIEGHGKFSPDSPMFLNLAGLGLAANYPLTIIVATAWKLSPVKESDAGDTAVSIARAVSDRGLKSLALPTFGAGRGGLREKIVLEEVLGALSENAPFAGLDDLTLISTNEDLKGFAYSTINSIELYQVTDIPHRAVIANDSYTLRDSLRASEQAAMFAMLLAARDVKMPVSIGVFGNAGMGKSYFMQLIGNEIKSLAGSQNRNGDQTEFISRICQINFNVWHNADGNIWINLAELVLNQLVMEYAPAGADSEIRNRLKHQLIADLRSSCDARQSALVNQQHALQLRKSAMAKLAGLESRQIETERKYSAAKWTYFLGVDLQAQDQVENAQKQAKQFGFKRLLESNEDSISLYNNMKELMGKGQAIMLAFGEGFSSWYGSLSSMLYLTLILIAVIWVGPALDYWVYNKLDIQVSELWVLTMDVLARGVILFGPLIIWIAAKFNTVAKIASELESVQLRFREFDPFELTNNQDSYNVQDTIKQIYDELGDINSKISSEQKSKSEAEKRIAQAQQRLQTIDSGGLDYHNQSRSDLIAAIRQDFSYLGENIVQWNKKYGSVSSLPVERIIVYVDDMDRCESGQVAETLQAIHILLNFELFAVVAAADSVWLEHSLYSTYVSNQNTADIETSSAWQSEEYCPQDYLDKIFQIPYSMPGMREDSYQQLMTDLIRPVSIQNADDVKFDASPPVLSEKLNTITALGLSKNQSKSVSNFGGTNERIEHTDNQVNVKQLANTKNLDQSTQDYTQNNSIPPSTLAHLFDWENAFLHALHPFINTPRIAKRLLNIYYLLRVQAAGKEEGFRQFIDHENGDYRAVLLLLALNIGNPKFGNGILRLLETVDQQETASWTQFIEKVTAEHTQKALNSQMDMVKRSLKKLDPLISIPDELAVFFAWAPEVGCYSFHWRQN